MTHSIQMRRLVSGRWLVAVALVAVLALLAGSCGNDPDGETAATATPTGGEMVATAAPVVDEPAGSAEEAEAEATVSVNAVMTLVALPVRAGPRTETTHAVPHVQTFVDPVPAVDAELRRRIYSLPGVEDRETIVSLNGTRALWFSTDLEPSKLVATLREREFAHIHPDGSLHVVLPVDRAIDATTAKWAELHPWVGREDFWDGMVMLYTPQTFEELEVTWQLIVDSYNFVTEQNLDAADFVSR